MNKRGIRFVLTGVLATAWLLLTSALAAEIEGVRLADTARVSDGGPELLLNGAGVRTRFFVKVYVGGLYLQEKTSSADSVIDSRGTKRISIHMLRAIGSDQMFRALQDGLNNNESAAQVASLEPQVRQLQSMFDIGRALEKGDTILIDLLPGRGARVAVNGESRGTIPGGEIGRALLRIWLGERPVDGDLKKAMLGGG